MALTAKSLFLYGFQVTELNNAIDYRVVAAETIRQATLRLGFYSLTGLMEEIERAMKAVAPALVHFTVSANRAFVGGTQNRVTISTDAAYFELNFFTGPRASSSSRTLIGFPAVDQTGALTYTGTTTAGTALVPDLVGYQYLSPDHIHKLFGSVNISASGEKESIVFNRQKFFQVQFKYEPIAKVNTEWVDFLDWAIQQRKLEFTPEITSPGLFYEGTLERTEEDGKGLGYRMKEMLPDYPFLVDTGILYFRQRNP